MERQEKRIPWRSAITEVHQDALRTHGVDQEQIIREFSYEEMIFFLLLSRRPTPTERTVLRAVSRPVGEGVIYFQGDHLERSM
jgi:hypothetical protein